MSRNEDYLDNLLTSVTDRLNEFDDDFEQNRESLNQSYQTQNDLPPKTQSALDEVREDNFLREFEQDFRSGKAEEDFMREFEQELDGDAAQMFGSADQDAYTSQMDQILGRAGASDAGSVLSDPSFQSDPDLEAILQGDFREDPVLNDLFQDDGQTVTLDDMSDDGQTAALSDIQDDGQTAALGDMSDDGQTITLDDIQAGAQEDLSTLLFDDVQEDASTAALDRLPAEAEEDGPTSDLNAVYGSMDDPVLSDAAGGMDLSNGQDSTTTAVPEGMEGLQDIFGNAPAAESRPDSAQPAQMDPALSAEIDSGLSEILNESDEEALAELAGILNPQGDAAESTEPVQKESSFSPTEPDFSFSDTAASQPDRSGRKAKKEKNPNSIFAKLSRLLFGTPEELNPEMAAEYAAAKAAAGGELDEKALKAKKKEEKELKKQQKKEAAELKKQEKEAAKAEKAAHKAAQAAAKPKKEKKPKNKNKAPKEPPLPKVPVVMMWTLSLSTMVLILLATSLLGYSTPVNASREAFESGDYVTAYEKLQGVKVKKTDEELYHAASTLAGIQTQLDAYTALMEQKQYEMALDALIRGAGRCRLHSADAQEWGVSEELNDLEAQFHQLLKEQFDVSKRRAKQLYNINKRSDYTLQLHEILSKLGLY